MRPWIATIIGAALGVGLAAAATAQTPGARLQQAFTAADADGDGYVDVNEYVAHFVGLYASVDDDRDGAVALADVPRVDPARFAAADRDGDGMVSLGEAVAERMILFFDIDANRDGAISLDELTAFEATLGK